MAFSVAEDELRGMDTTALVGHLAAWNYYQSVDTPQNKQFVSNFKAYCKKNNLPDGDKRVTDDVCLLQPYGRDIGDVLELRGNGSKSGHPFQKI